MLVLLYLGYLNDYLFGKERSIRLTMSQGLEEFEYWVAKVTNIGAKGAKLFVSYKLTE